MATTAAAVALIGGLTVKSVLSKKAASKKARRASNALIEATREEHGVLG